MDDLNGVGNIAAHGVGALSSGGLGAWLVGFLKSNKEVAQQKERQALDLKIAVTLAELVMGIKEIRDDQAKHASYGERLALCERDIESFHKRLDGREPRKK